MIDATALAEKPVLEGDRIRLVPLSERHADAFHATFQDPETRRLTGTHHDWTRAEIGAWVAQCAERTDRLDLAIEDRETGAYLGELALSSIDRDNAHGSFRIALVPAATGRGLGPEAIRLLLGHAFDRVGLHRVQLEVYSYNERARRAYEACGFALEGRMREALYWDGAWHDVLLMAALRPSGPARTAQ
ncbi:MULTISPECIES: GNAT family protein [unclassified Streptomyces]|uniref:GNAT family N-acetyltransferase n=1 Tax=unclassified Streptomyces TaxID=2593676 RepID=UPI00037565DD|nr:MULTISPECIES: GNAT family protein [unclassified Streptomyces]MYT30150.1 GNAT family N-acetyltransferase [Streptomyces sp. SID8354]